MAVIDDKLILEMVHVIVHEVDPERIIVFGSQARGDPHKGSDIDFLIVQSDSFDQSRSRRKEMGRLWRKLATFPVPKDILLVSREEVEFWKDSLNNVVARALREGKVVYERS